MRYVSTNGDFFFGTVGRLEGLAALRTVAMLNFAAVMDGLSPFDNANRFACLADGETVKPIPGSPDPFGLRLYGHRVMFLPVI
jgi:hypothetical protein